MTEAEVAEVLLLLYAAAGRVAGEVELRAWTLALTKLQPHDHRKVAAKILRAIDFAGSRCPSPALYVRFYQDGRNPNAAMWRELA